MRPYTRGIITNITNMHRNIKPVHSIGSLEPVSLGIDEEWDVTIRARVDAELPNGTVYILTEQELEELIHYKVDHIIAGD